MNYLQNRRFRDRAGNQYMLLGQRILRNSVVMKSPAGCPTVVSCNLVQDRLVIDFQRGRVVIAGVVEVPTSG